MDRNLKMLGKINETHEILKKAVEAFDKNLYETCRKQIKSAMLELNTARILYSDPAPATESNSAKGDLFDVYSSENDNVFQNVEAIPGLEILSSSENLY